LLYDETPMTKRNRRSVLLVDLDGTLIDPAEGIIGSFRFALETLGRIPPPAAELTWIIGPPLRRSFAEMLGATGDPEQALRIYRGRYSTEGLFEAVVYDGVSGALAELRAAGARLFLCTSKPAAYAERILRHFDLRCHFEGVYGADLDGRYEDKGDLIAHILESQGLEAGDCCMWGDRKHDAIGASRHAIPTIGAIWGYGGASELREAGAAILCASLSEVPAAFWALPRGLPLGKRAL
jgi:phosphoglycolate phosphatase